MTELERLTHLRHLLSDRQWTEAIESTILGDWHPTKSVCAIYLLEHLPLPEWRRCAYMWAAYLRGCAKQRSRKYTWLRSPQAYIDSIPRGPDHD